MAHDNEISRTVRWLIVTVVLSLLSVTAAAERFRLAPAQASYRLVVNGLPLGLEARVDLEEESGQQWYLRFLIDSRLVYHREQSRFSWRGCQARPSDYDYLSKGFGIRRGGGVHFDWENRRAVIDGNRDFDLPARAVDALAATMMARCHLARGEQELDFAVADPDGLQRYRFRVLGREALKTPAGTFDTLRLERIYAEGNQRTQLWVATDLNYFMVRMDHAENLFIRGRIELTDHGLLHAGEALSQR